MSPPERTPAPGEAAFPLGPWVRADAPLLPRALRRAADLPGNLARHRALWIAGARRELAARFTGTIFGRLWPAIAPLALFGVYYALFARAMGMSFDTTRGADPAATGVWIFLGVLTWSAFAESLARGTLAFVERGELLKRSAFPAEVLPFQTIVAQHVLLGAGLAVFVAVATLGGLWPAPGSAALAAPLLLVLQALFAFGLALATATLHALLRDTAHALSLATTLWMFATPIFWIPSTRLLPGIEPYLSWIDWNPMHAFVAAWRHALMSGAPQEGFTVPFATSLAASAAWTACALVFGAFVFALGERRLPDEV